MPMRLHACGSIALTEFETQCFLRLFLMSTRRYQAMCSSARSCGV